MTKRKIKTPGVYHGSNGTYYLKYKNKTYRGFETIEDAEIKKAQLQLLGDDNKTTYKVNDIALDFLDNEYNRYNNSEIKYGTYLKKKQSYDIHIFKRLGNKRIENLSLIELRNFRNEVGFEDLSTTQKNYILQLLVQIIKHGVRYFNVQTNNTIELVYFKQSRSESRNRLNDVRNTLSEEEFKTFISHVEEVDYHYLFTLLFLTGARISEVMALKWEDLKKGNLNIYENITNKTENVGYELTDTKTVSSERKIKISGKLEKELLMLKEYKKQFYGFKNTWFILGDSSPLSTTTVNRKKKEAIDSSGVKYFTNHQLRHSFVTNAFNRGEQLVSIGQYIGHKNISETMRTYAHLSEESSDKFNDYIENSSQNLLNTDLSVKKPTV